MNGMLMLDKGMPAGICLMAGHGSLHHWRRWCRFFRTRRSGGRTI